MLCHLKKIFFLLCFIFYSGTAMAGKVEEVQKTIAESCGLKIDSSEALRLVKDLFMSCTIGGKTRITPECEAPCLKTEKKKVEKPSSGDEKSAAPESTPLPPPSIKY